VPGYQILDRLGGGGGGVVYRAVQLVADREVAVKVLSVGGPRDRFDREVRSLAGLDHPNVVRVFEVGTCAAGPFFSMELMTGGTLAGRIRECGRLTPADAADAVKKAAHGVAAAHTRNVLHRDLKPSNVLLSATGDPKVADFGLAKEWEAGPPDPDDPTADLATPGGAFLGTPQYAAPEQAAGRSDEHDPRTDVYGLGAVLYHALTGEPPFTGSSSATILQRVLTAAPVPPRQKDRRIPRELESVCLKCLAKNPEDRYATADEVAAELDLWQREGWTRATPTRWRRAVRAARRNAVLLVAGLVLVIAAVTLYRNDPDRPVREVRSELDHGRPVTFFTADGLTHYKIIAGDAETRVVLNTDKSLTVSSWGLCLVELVPDSRCDEYTVAARIRHDNSDAAGVVGIFAARRSIGGPSGNSNLVVGQVFNDVWTEAEIVARAFPLGPPPGLAPGNSTVRLGLGVSGVQPDGVQWAILPNLVAGAPFTPAGVTSRIWRNLELAVFPDGATGVFGGMPVGRLGVSAVRDYLDLQATSWRMRNPTGPPWYSIEPPFVARGGVGLVVYRGSATCQFLNISPSSGESESQSSLRR
jgi:serine/threonine-protein kinase